MTDTEHIDELEPENTSPESVTDASDTPEGGTDTTVEPEPELARPLPSPKTARLTYCSFADMRPSPRSKYAPMGLLGYIAILVLTAVPGIGFVIAAITACASKKLACRRLSLAILLIQTFIIAVIGVAAVLIIYFDIDIVGSLLSALGR